MLDKRAFGRPFKPPTCVVDEIRKVHETQTADGKATNAPEHPGSEEKKELDGSVEHAEAKRGAERVSSPAPCSWPFPRRGGC
jgi:hypothetical protein